MIVILLETDGRWRICARAGEIRAGTDCTLSLAVIMERRLVVHACDRRGGRREGHPLTEDWNPVGGSRRRVQRISFFLFFAVSKDLSETANSSAGTLDRESSPGLFPFFAVRNIVFRSRVVRVVSAETIPCESTSLLESGKLRLLFRSFEAPERAAAVGLAFEHVARLDERLPP